MGSAVRNLVVATVMAIVGAAPEDRVRARWAGAVVLVLILSVTAGLTSGTASNPPRTIGGQIATTSSAAPSPSWPATTAGAGHVPEQRNPMSCSRLEGYGTAECQSSQGFGSASPSSPAYPDQRWGSSMTFDARDGYLLMGVSAGGKSDAWTFSAGKWTDITSPTDSPPALNFTCLTYDWRDNYVLLFGGGEGGIGTPTAEMNETWIFSDGSWTDLKLSYAPPPLIYPSCTYDAADGYVLLFGGVTGAQPSHTTASGFTLDSSDQTWEFSGGHWTNVTGYDSPHPSARFGASMAYDEVDRYVVLYGGANGGSSTANGSCKPPSCSYLNDTWKFVGGEWTNITTAASLHGTPPGRLWASMVNDSTEGYVLIYGGQANGYKSENASQNATWKFVGGTWTNITAESVLTPGTRFIAAMGYDSNDGVILFSGQNTTLNGSQISDATWSFNQGQWHSLTYPVNFTETGLASGFPKKNWVAKLDANSLAPYSSSAVFGRPNGTYAYTVAAEAGVTGYIAIPSSGSVTVDGLPTRIDVNFVRSSSAFLVDFRESGLPSGTAWNVTLEAYTVTSTSSTIALHETNGTYAYSVMVAGMGSTGGSFTVKGRNLTIPVSFYKVTFNEKGLPAGTSWTVTANGTPRGSTTSNIVFYLANGTYAYLISPIAGYKTNYTGSVLVSGANPATIIVKWAEVTYPVKFVETGLPKGTEWSVVIDGMTHSPTGKSTKFSLPNGTFPFTVTAAGYTETSTPTSPLTVNGAAVNVAVTFTLSQSLRCTIAPSLSTSASPEAWEKSSVKLTEPSRIQVLVVRFDI